MIAIALILLCSLIGYIAGSIPFGWLIVRLVKGIDLRKFGSGRTGGTNVFRAAGFPAGLATALLDVAKGAVTVLLIRHFVTGTYGWAEALAGLAVVIGHNYSVFLKFKGGAGGATAIGTGMAFWVLGTIPALIAGLFMLFVVGYASLATIAAAVGVAIALTYAAATGFPGIQPSYAVFGWGIVILVLIALRPNLERLKNGTENRVQILKRRPAP